jgi:hypothetical protein
LHIRFKARLDVKYYFLLSTTDGRALLQAAAGRACCKLLAGVLVASCWRACLLQAAGGRACCKLP